MEGQIGSHSYGGYAYDGGNCRILEPKMRVQFEREKGAILNMVERERERERTETSGGRWRCWAATGSLEMERELERRRDGGAVVCAR